MLVALEVSVSVGGSLGLGRQGGGPNHAVRGICTGYRRSTPRPALLTVSTSCPQPWISLHSLSRCLPPTPQPWQVDLLG